MFALFSFMFAQTCRRCFAERAQTADFNRVLDAAMTGTLEEKYDVVSNKSILYAVRIYSSVELDI